MSQFNDRLKQIKIKNLAIFIIIAYLVLFILGKTIGFINEKYFYVFILLYFVFELRDFSLDFKDDFFNVFSDVSIKTILLIVTANIFFSYGMLYLSYLLINHFPFLNFLVTFSVPSMSILSSLPVIGVLVMTVVLSPIVEELIFRGVLLNKMGLIVPTLFAVLISSLLFGALHSFGSIFSAFIFAVCMAILYLKTENICVPILAHFLNNLFAEIIRLVDVNEVLFTDANVMMIVSALAIISAVILFISIFTELNNIK